MTFRNELIEKVEIWINTILWSDEDEIAPSIAITNNTFYDSEPEDLTIEITKEDTYNYKFTASFTISSSEPYKDDVPYLPCSIDVTVTGEITLINYEDVNDVNIEDSNEWEISSNYSVSSSEPYPLYEEEE